jgi:hypothetical protein
LWEIKGAEDDFPSVRIGDLLPTERISSKLEYQIEALSRKPIFGKK